MFESIMNFFKKLGKSENKEAKSKETAKERLHLVLMQDRANVSADFLEMMKQEIIDVIKKYIEVDEKEIDVRLTNEVKEDGTTGAPSLYANIPILNIKNEMKKEIVKDKKEPQTNESKAVNNEVKEDKNNKGKDENNTKSSDDKKESKKEQNIKEINKEEKQKKEQQEETKQTEEAKEKSEEDDENNKEQIKDKPEKEQELVEKTDKDEENKLENEE